MLVPAPIQSERGLAAAITVGNELTVTVADALPVQLLPSVPVTLYRVVVAGDTVIAVVLGPLLQI